MGEHYGIWITSQLTALEDILTHIRWWQHSLVNLLKITGFYILNVWIFVIYKLYLIKIGRIRTFGKCNWQPTTNGLNLLQQRTLSTSILLIHSTSAPSFPLDLSSALNPANHSRVLPCLYSSLFSPGLLLSHSWGPFDQCARQRLVGPRAQSL